MTPLRFLALLALAATFLPVASAQRVRWEPAGGNLALHQNNELSLIFEDCEPETGFSPPDVPGLVFGSPTRGEQTSMSVVNGRATRRRLVYLTFPVRPTLAGRVTLPAFEIATDAGPRRVEGVSFDVVEPTVGGTNLTLDRAAAAELAPGRTGTWWTGEVVPLTYTLGVTARVSASIAGEPEWTPAPLIAEPWSDPETYSATAAGDTRNHVLYRTRGYIREPGRHRLGGVNQLINVRVPSSGFNVFQSLQTQQFALGAPPLEVTVKPLPTPAPADFNGAVGGFLLTSRVVPREAEVGEPLTWTLTLEGTGNWPDIPALPAREVSRDFRVISPPPRRTPDEGKLFDATLSEDIVLVGTRPGTYTLGPVTWSYFDPARGEYVRVQTEPVTVTLTAPAAPPADASRPTKSDRPEEVLAPGRAVPAAPPGLLRDPVAEAAPVAAPWSLTGWFSRLIAALLILPLAAFALALRAARHADPGRRAREARRQLAQVLAGPPPENDAAQIAWVRRWRDLTIRCWNLPSAAPAAPAFATDEAWSRLWREADAYLFGDAIPLPEDWSARARAALTARPAPRFAWRSLWRRRHFLPLVLLALGLGFVPVDVSATSPDEAYARGDYATAASGWRNLLKEQPTRWSAHHNLALALAQQGQWEQAAAHATAAFVQNPRDRSVRWHLEHTFARAGHTPPYLGQFTGPAPGPRHRLARLASPAAWQRIALAGIGLIVVAGLLHLLSAHRLGPARLRRLSPVLIIIALLFLLGATQSWPLYGPARDARAVIVPAAVTMRSIPTDLDIDQETSPLAAGSLAIVEHEFLGWSHLAFPNGQTGWVRTESLLRLWR
jgi:tetratricopeptide (TPR) repeat protein